MICTATLIAPVSIKLFIGALLFGISDSLLGISTFILRYPGDTYAVWFSYYLAQILIITGIISLHNFKFYADTSSGIKHNFLKLE